MFQNSGGFSILGLSMSRISTFGTVLIMWLFWSSLLIEAQDAITSPVEVSALQDIKSSLIDINKNLSNWNRGDPCTSNWTGVLCFNTTMDDDYLHVRKLQLLNLNLSGTLSPSLGNLSYMEILDFMWNNISGSIPKEIGEIESLKLLLLNGNHLTGPLPEELGYLPNLDRIQIDENHISGSIPVSFAYLNMTKHFHMNNNSISGQIPPELSRLPRLVHFLLDNNNLSGYLPPQLSELPNLQILYGFPTYPEMKQDFMFPYGSFPIIDPIFVDSLLTILFCLDLFFVFCSQLDNNNFDGATIPDSYGNMTKLLKLSLRNCSLQGPIPDLSRIPNLGYLDLSTNQLNGSIPSERLSENITTIDLSNNDLTGSIPASFSGLPCLQKLSVANNSLNGSILSTLWQSRTLNASERLKLDFENNRLTNISGNGNISLPQNVSLWLQGNPVCSNSNLVQFCGSQNEDVEKQGLTNFADNCPTQACPYVYSPTSPVDCFCAAPLIVGYRLKSPGFSNFLPYRDAFKEHLTSGLNLELYQLYLENFQWEEGPRLKMQLQLFPVYDASNKSSHVFNASEVLRIMSKFTGWDIHHNETFGPYELLYFPLLEPYNNVFVTSPSSSGTSKGALAGIVLGAIAGTVALCSIVSLLIIRMYLRNYRLRNYRANSRRRHASKALLKIDGIKDFTYAEMALATNNFNSSTQLGQGGYGIVYKGILADGTVVAVKRAQEHSLQGEKEFLTEIELLSRLHHRNLVSLVGYCDEEYEQMLVYEFMSNGTLRDHISAKSKEPLSFALRVRIALGSAKGILYLHKEADPPIFHRDIKASNILLDSNYNAKVADFGLSRLAPAPDIEGAVPAHVSTVVKGTPVGLLYLFPLGYLDPEYFLTHKLTDKSDVYSLGVVFLELLTGMQPITHGKNIVREVNLSYQSGMIFSFIDGRMGSYPSNCMEKFLNLAMKCCHDETDSRPSMADVVRELETIWAMIADSDMKTTDTVITDPGKSESSPSSSSMVKHPYVSSDVSGSDLVSGVAPSIPPR
ncbi:probable LRR receptor-like serine/threonine-protein kinase At1g06840 isoform X3 [Hevea brasiliensis]|nr:probable LRR receptor-like serine/threonine-protein kinase At1g06840 isoform X3 [Hevea brasiliensis]XP_057987503.1 probable LRR receptor-like serine/threonine-protein kinase At1g06840 isoform X3 [Hevea brasiliensis]XP_057987504.1 probable LRR receptor-like serine/threonine-protein kinase At1g06840 isoform X3 [Hevea brasiliensis]XP_057987505.1 probable LRR receptor-like serine/threonine-protein kinase At1g06840 isoform X3 [Hevea brasiliensis]XP_057987506.1 probable LRR receptor-like serine/th